MADIIETAIENGSFKMLVDALKTANLVDTFKSSGPFTVFAPTDAAFAKLPAGASKALLTDTERLKKVLNYHVVTGKVMAEDVRNIESATTLEGESLVITIAESIKVNDADVLATDIVCDNGIIHIIDTVLMPKEASSSND